MSISVFLSAHAIQRIDERILQTDLKIMEILKKINKSFSTGILVKSEHFDEAWLMKGFDFDNFVKLLRDGEIKVDIRIGQYSDGSPHDRGTGFRIFPDKLDLCFSKRKRIV